MEIKGERIVQWMHTNRQNSCPHQVFSFFSKIDFDDDIIYCLINQ